MSWAPARCWVKFWGLGTQHEPDPCPTEWSFSGVHQPPGRPWNSSWGRGQVQGPGRAEEKGRQAGLRHSWRVTTSLAQLFYPGASWGLERVCKLWSLCPRSFGCGLSGLGWTHSWTNSQMICSSPCGAWASPSGCPLISLLNCCLGPLAHHVVLWSGLENWQVYARWTQVYSCSR